MDFGELVVKAPTKTTAQTEKEREEDRQVKKCSKDKTTLPTILFDMGFSVCVRAFVAAAICAAYTCDAFVPSQQVFGGFSSQTVVETKDFGSVFSATRKTRLSMIMEQFVTDRDEATRKKDTDKYLQEVQKRVDRINELEATIEDLGDDELQAKTEEFKARLAKGEDINGPILEEAFAVVREAAW